MKLTSRDLPRGYFNTFSHIIPQRNKGLDYYVRQAKMTSMKNNETLKTLRENLFKEGR